MLRIAADDVNQIELPGCMVVAIRTIAQIVMVGVTRSRRDVLN